MGVIFPEEYGGAGMGYVEYATIIEELSRVDGSVGISVAAHNSLCSNHIYMFGTEEQKQKFLVPLAQGRTSGRVGIDGSRAQARTLRARARPPSGRTAAGSSTARRISSRTPSTATPAWRSPRPTARKRIKGITAFIFEKGMKGFAPGKKENKLGLRASETASVVFEDCHVPDEQPSRRRRHGLHSGDADSRRRAHLDRRARGRHRAGRVRVGCRYSKERAAVRQAHLGVSGDPVQARRHGDADRGRAPADVPRRRI